MPREAGNIWRTKLLDPRQLPCKERSGSAARLSGHLLRGTRHHDAAAGSARAWPYVDHPVGLGHRTHVVLDHHYGIAGIDQALQLHQQPVGIRRVPPGARLVENVQASAALAALKLGRQLDALRLATGKLSGRLPQAPKNRRASGRARGWKYVSYLG